MGTDIIHRLPGAPWDSVTIGTADACTLQLIDRSGYTSREHARLERVPSGWIVRDLGSKNGTRIDGTRRSELRLEEAHHRELPEVVRLAGANEVDPDTRILKMLAARGSHVAAEIEAKAERL